LSKDQRDQGQYTGFRKIKIQGGKKESLEEHRWRKEGKKKPDHNRNWGTRKSPFACQKKLERVKKRSELGSSVKGAQEKN